MGSLILISGPNGSGKSAYAEFLASRAGGSLFYIATMLPRTEENLARIEAHRKRRAPLGFRTVELPRGIKAAPVSSEGVVLLEDISNLLANELFEGGGTADSALRDVLALLERCRLLIAVTISGLRAEEADGETAAYINDLNSINGRLFELADAAVSMRDGIAYYTKGNPHDLL